MKTKFMLLFLATLLLCSLAAFSFSTPALAADPTFTGSEWNTNLTYMINREDPHSNFIAYDNESEALKYFTLYQSESPYYSTLNGEWQFYWVRRPSDRPSETNMPGFTTLGFNDSGWDKVNVPHSWQVNWTDTGAFKYDHVIYTNSTYPWTGSTYGNGTVTAPAAPQVFNPVATYRKHFTIPQQWKNENRSVTLRFNGVESNCYVWVNGRAVGYGEDSFTTKEFDITDYVDYNGDNVVVVQVFRWSSGSWFEDQDFLRLSGICRDVFLVGRSKVTLYDVELNTTPVVANVYGDDWNLNVTSFIRSLEGASQAERDASVVEYKLYDGNQVVASYTSGALNFDTVAANTLDDVNNRGKVVTRAYLGAQVNNNMVISKPREWSAEHPNLYKLVVTLKQGSKLIETTCFRVGFRESKIINESNSTNVRWTINGSRLMIYGTNTHEINPNEGRHLTTELIIKDLEIMKANNINTIRFSHYPHDLRYYDLADEWGLYLMDEGNVECHGNTSLVSNNTTCAVWGPSLRDRENNMIERSKNYTSVISYSMGNENNSAGTTFAAWCTTWTKDRLRGGFIGTGNWITDELRRDYRPVHAQFRNTEADMNSAMYTVAATWANTCNSNAKPSFLCEYVHAMGNSNGNWDEYIAVFDQYPKSCGGCIWEWVDHSVWTPVPGNPATKYLAYGGKWGDTPNDGNFCADGMLLADRTPRPQVAQMKHAYRMITATAVDASTFAVKNKFLFTSTDQYEQYWTLTENGAVIQSGVGNWTVGPAPAGVATTTLTTVNFAVPYTTPAVVKPGAVYMFNVYFAEKADTLWAKAGHVLSASQIPVTQFAKPGDKAALAAGGMDIVNGAESIDITGKDFELSISKVNGATGGAITKYTYKGRNLLGVNPLAGQPGGPIPNFWRAPNDNEFGASVTGFNSWRTIGRDRTTTTVDIKVNSNILFTTVIVPGIFSGKSNATYTIKYTIYPSGEVDINYHYVFPTLSSNNYPQEIGSMMTVNGAFGNLTWFGRGPETYTDRKTGTPITLYKSTVKEQYFPYLQPIDTGNHVDTHWFALTGDDGFGIVVKPTAGGAIASAQAGTGTQGLFQFNALYTTPEGLSSNTEGAQQPARYNRTYLDVRWYNDITLRVNYVSTGVAGDNSWGALPLTTYRVNASGQTFDYGYSILPVDGFSAESAMAYAQTSFSGAVNLSDLIAACEAQWPDNAQLAGDIAVARGVLVNDLSTQADFAIAYDKLYDKLASLGFVLFRYGNESAYTIVAGKTLTIEAALPSVDSEPLIMIAALYTKQGKLIAAAQNIGTLTKFVEEDRVAFNLNLKIPADTVDGAYIKVFAWDATTFIPIRDAFVFTAQ